MKTPLWVILGLAFVNGALPCKAAPTNTDTTLNPAVSTTPIASEDNGSRDLITKDGKIYKNYKLIGYTRSSLDIANQNENGIIQIPYGSLPDDLRKKYDPDFNENQTHEEYLQSELRLPSIIAPDVARARDDYSKASKVTVTGQVFIATQGGDNIKLGAIHVLLYGETELQALIVPRKEELLKQQQYVQPYLDNFKTMDQATLKKLQALSLEMKPPYTYPSLAGILNEENSFFMILADRKKSWLSSNNFFKNLPPALTDAETDADGKFSISVPATGNYVLVTAAKLNTGMTEERYYWMVRVPMSGETGKNVLLTNENMSITNSPDSLVQCSQ